MKVRELIAALQEHAPDAEVLTEGCDCWGDSDAVKRVFSAAYTGPHVIIVRRGRDTAYQEDYEGATALYAITQTHGQPSDEWDAAIVADSVARPQQDREEER